MFFSSNNSSINNLGGYLAGPLMVEGDGSIIVPKTIRNQKGKLLYPSISCLHYFIEIEKKKE